jgi:hypothetical protein
MIFTDTVFDRRGADGIHRHGVAAPTAQMKAAVADSARPSADTARDENRKPAEMLEFAGITPGKIVVDLLPGTPATSPASSPRRWSRTAGSMPISAITMTKR